MEVLLNGEELVGSPFAVEVSPASTNWIFGSIPNDSSYELSEGGAVATKNVDHTYTGVVADSLLDALL